MPKCVLIVDDDPNVVELLLSVMNLFGVETQVKHNGKDGLEAIKANPPDAVILDLMMPIMDGFTMLSLLRKEEIGKDMPVIILSGIADQKGMVDRLPGITGAITKGRFSMIDLKDLLDKAGVFEAAPAPKPAPVEAAKPAETPAVTATPVVAVATPAPVSAPAATPVVADVTAPATVTPLVAPKPEAAEENPMAKAS